MDFQRTFSGAPWEAKVGYCRGVRAGNLIFITGTAPVADDGSTFAPGNAYAQTKRCFSIIEKALNDPKPGPRAMAAVAHCRISGKTDPGIAILRQMLGIGLPADPAVRKMAIPGSPSCARCSGAKTVARARARRTPRGTWAHRANRLFRRSSMRSNPRTVACAVGRAGRWERSARKPERL